MRKRHFLKSVVRDNNGHCLWCSASHTIIILMRKAALLYTFPKSSLFSFNSTSLLFVDATLWAWLLVTRVGSNFPKPLTCLERPRLALVVSVFSRQAALVCPVSPALLLSKWISIFQILNLVHLQFLPASVELLLPLLNATSVEWQLEINLFVCHDSWDSKNSNPHPFEPDTQAVKTPKHNWFKHAGVFRLKNKIPQFAVRNT